MSTERGESNSAEIREARLRRRVDRLRTQRDHWKNEHDKLHAFLESFPFYRREREKLDVARAKDLQRKKLEQRCEEQAALIKMLTPQELA